MGMNKRVHAYGKGSTHEMGGMEEEKAEALDNATARVAFPKDLPYNASLKHGI